MNPIVRVAFAVALALTLIACGPQDGRPGLWLTGHVVERFPDDWSFADAHREIAIQVATPYLIAHSVTIWCVQRDGRLYVASANAATKNWPRWVDNEPNVRLKIGANIYRVRLTKLVGPEAIEPVRQAYEKKYGTAGGLDAGGGTRYWRVDPRAG